MNTRKIATEYRLRHWSEIMLERKGSGLSIKEYCANAGFHENVYYYWQRKLRETACERLTEGRGAESQTGLSVSNFKEIKLAEPQMLPAAKPVSQICVEIGGCKITADSSYPTETLAALLRELNKPC